MQGKVTELGKKFYEEHLKPILEPQENGKFVAIEPESQEYFIGTTAIEALKKGNASFPEKILFLARIGFPTAHKIGGHGYNKSIR
jgi:hypothetical protein